MWDNIVSFVDKLCEFVNEFDNGFIIELAGKEYNLNIWAIFGIVGVATVALSLIIRSIRQLD